MTRPSAAWAFVLPALSVIGLFFIVPVFAGLVLSLTDFDLYALASLDNLRFVGLDNYRQTLTRPLFWQALGNTVYFVVLGVPLSIVVSLGCAVLRVPPDGLATIEWDRHGWDFYAHLLEHLKPYLWPYVLGNTVLGAAAAVVIYFILRALLERRARRGATSTANP